MTGAAVESPVLLVSVVVPTYNSSRYLPETLRSILAQEVGLEVLVVDDGSTDDTEVLVRGWPDARVRYVKQAASGGPSHPRNVGIGLARGQYIALCDSDDVMLPGKLAEAVALLQQRPHLGLVFANMVLCHDDGTELPGTFLDNHPAFLAQPHEPQDGRSWIIRSQHAYEALLRDNYIGISGVVAPKAVLQAVGGFDEALSPAADWDITLRITRDYDIGYIDMVGHRYRLRSSGLTGQGKVPMAADQIRVLTKQLGSPMSPRAARGARRFLSAVHVGLAYHYREAGKLQLARQYAWRSLRAAPSWAAVKTLIAAWLGPRAVAMVRAIRRRERAVA